ncbi:MAG TPA: peptide ABC transporter substrate-binding protein [Actinomycetota bacterium]
MKGRLVAACALMVAIAVIIPATAWGQDASTPSSSAGADEPVTFTLGVVGELNSANPFKQIDTSEAFVGTLMYASLLRLAQKDYATEPELATEVPTQENGGISADGLTWTFHLRDGLTWSDGEPITAHDFVWTADFIMENEISSYIDGYRFTDSIEALDDQTIVWKTTRPTLVPGFPGYNLILPEHVWGKMSVKEIKEYENFPDPVVSGPFNLTEWNQAEYWAMDARPDYWEGDPTIQRLVFRNYNSDEAVVQALLKGAIDYSLVPTSDLYEAVKDRPGITAVTASAESFWQLSFNVVNEELTTALDASASTAHPAVLDPRVRQAVEYAIDRETLVDRVLQGYGSPGSTPIVPFYEEWHWQPPEDVYRSFDPAEANRMLDEAGYLDTDKDGIREMPEGGDPLQLRLYLATTDSDGLQAAPFIRGWLRDIGIDVSIKSMTDGKLYDDWYDYDWDMILYSWGTTPDPDFLLSTFTSGQCGYWSDTCYSNPEYDDLYKEQQTTLDPDARHEIVTQMQQMLYEDSPEIVLWYPNAFEAWRGDRWTGFLRWPEPDGLAFWYNVYSVQSVHPIEGAQLGGAEAGPAGWMWLVGAGALGGVLAAATSRRRRRANAYYV